MPPPWLRSIRSRVAAWRPDEATRDIDDLVRKLAEAHGYAVSGSVPALSAAYLAREAQNHLGIGADQASRMPPRLQDLPAKEQSRVIRNRAALMARMQHDEDRKVQEDLRIHESRAEEKAQLSSQFWSRIGAGSISLVKAGVEFGLSGNEHAQEILQGYLKLKGTLDAIGALDLVRGGGQLLGLPTAGSVAGSVATRAMHPLYRGALHLAGMTGLEVGGASVGAVGGSMLAALVGGGLGAYSIAEQFMPQKHRYLGNFIGKAEYGAMESVRGSTGFDTAGLLYGGRNPFGGDWAQNDKTARMEQALLKHRADEEAARQFAAPYVGDLRSMGLQDALRAGRSQDAGSPAADSVAAGREPGRAGQGRRGRRAAGHPPADAAARRPEPGPGSAQEPGRAAGQPAGARFATAPARRAKGNDRQGPGAAEGRHARRGPPRPQPGHQAAADQGKVRAARCTISRTWILRKGEWPIAGNQNVRAAAQRRYEQTNKDRNLGDVKGFLSVDAEVNEQIARQRKDSTETQIGDAQTKLDNMEVKHQQIVDTLSKVAERMFEVAKQFENGMGSVEGTATALSSSLKSLDDKMHDWAMRLNSGQNDQTVSRTMTRVALGGN